MKGIILVWLLLGGAVAQAQTYDVVVYGATPAGITAAVAAGRSGEKTLLVEPSYLVGGMMAGGLTKTDIGDRKTVGGLAAEFFQRVDRYYATTYGAGSTQEKESHQGLSFEPHVATQIFGEMLQSAGVEVRTKERLEEVTAPQDKIEAITLRQTETGAETQVTARYFIDGSYEGDLMAAAHVPYRVGREARAEYHESLAGLTAGPAAYLGSGDQRVQSYNIRSTLTNRPDLCLPIPKPEHYDPTPFLNLVKTVNARHFKTFEQLFTDAPDWGPINGKYDPNKADDPGVNFSYSDGSDEERARIYAAVRDRWLSEWYLLQNDPSLPADFRASARTWGLPKDEFLESGHVSPQIYVRVARRLLGRYLLTEDDLVDHRLKDDGICLATYNIDCHPIQTLWTPKGMVEEGGISGLVDPWEIPYRALTPFAPPTNLLVVCAVSATHVAYCSLRMEPVFMMIGHAAGLAAALAAKGNLAVQDVPIDQLHAELTQAGIPFHAPFRPVVGIDLTTPEPLVPGQPAVFKTEPILVQGALASYSWNFDGTGQVQSTEADPTYTFATAGPQVVSLIATDADGKTSRIVQRTVQVGNAAASLIEVASADARREGSWLPARALIENGGRRALTDENRAKGQARATFTPALPHAGTYEVVLVFPRGPHAATNVPIVIHHAGGDTQLTFNERDPGTPFSFAPLGAFPFDAGTGGSVLISNDGTDGIVGIDEVRWIPTNP